MDLRLIYWKIVVRILNYSSIVSEIFKIPLKLRRETSYSLIRKRSDHLASHWPLRRKKKVVSQVSAEGGQKNFEKKFMAFVFHGGARFGQK